MITKFKITNINCEACLKLSDTALKGLPGVIKVVIAKDGSGIIDAAAEITWDQIKNALAEVGKNAILIK